MRESIPRQADKSRVPEEEKGVWNSQGGREEKHLFFSPLHSLVLVTQNTFLFFSLSLELMITQQTTQFKLCTKDYIHQDFPGGSEGKESACNARDPGLIPGSGRSLGEGNDNPLQYSCLENPMDG